jgi:hypothetical protein
MARNRKRTDALRQKHEGQCVDGAAGDSEQRPPLESSHLCRPARTSNQKRARSPGQVRLRRALRNFNLRRAKRVRPLARALVRPGAGVVGALRSRARTFAHPAS